MAEANRAKPKALLPGLSDLSIGRRLSLSLGVLLLLTMLISAISVATMQSIVGSEIPVIDESHGVYDGLMNMRRQEKDFLLRDTISGAFYSSGQSSSARLFEELYDSTAIHVKNVKSFESGKGSQEGVSRAARIESTLSEYRLKFQELVQKIRQRGFKGYGLAGEMSGELDSIDLALGGSEAGNALQGKIIGLRLIEEQYLSRKEPEQAKQAVEMIASLGAGIESSALSRGEKEKMEASLKTHSEKFNALAEIDSEIGVKFNEGLQGQLIAKAGEVERLVNAEDDAISSDISRLTAEAVQKIMWLIALFILFGVAAGYFITMSISEPIKKLTDAAEELSKGNLDAKIDESLRESNDELGALARAFNRTAVSLKLSIGAKKDEKKAEQALREALERQG
ncbi:HAMP domain protein [uncultured archaeon]|nr:HAMP domain protein [uncultured archaeon]